MRLAMPSFFFFSRLLRGMKPSMMGAGVGFPSSPIFSTARLGSGAHYLESRQSLTNPNTMHAMNPIVRRRMAKYMVCV
jgi:hypothetical protein